MDRDDLCVPKTLETHEGLDEEGLCELEIDVHDGHHSDAHVDCT